MPTPAVEVVTNPEWVRHIKMYSLDLMIHFHQAFLEKKSILRERGIKPTIVLCEERERAECRQM